ncbi:MAG: HEAT repeat domain-containing protein [Planctomycetota bacterium]
MHRYQSHLLVILTCCIGTIVSSGCAGAKPMRKPEFWPFNRQTSDTVPGIRPPAERVAVLRKMGKKAAWAKPEEQERISGELASAFRGEPDPLVRAEIVRAISRYPTVAAASVLEVAVDDSDADVRLIACEAWGRRGGPEAVAKLSEALASDVDPDVRLMAARGLGKAGESGAVAPLGEALEDRDPAMQYVAVESLREVTGEDFDNDVNQWRQYVKGEEPTPSQPPVSIAERFRRLF